MPGLTTDDAMRMLRRQMRRVRWRRNGYLLQRALYLFAATLAVAAAVLVVLALRADELVFVAVLFATGAVALGVVGGLTIATARGWLRHSRTAAWIDRAAALEGRLASLSELAVRPGPEPDLLPLLVEQNLARVPTWEPDRLLPDTFPHAALASAVTAAAALMAALAIAPRLDPPAAAPASVRLVDRVTRLEGAPRGASAEVAAMAAGGADAAGRLQDYLRRAFWGTRWQALQQAIARAEPHEAAGTTAGPVADGDLEQTWRIARSSPRAAGAAPGRPDADARQASSPADATEPTAAAQPRPQGDGPSAGGRPARGAGTGTDPDLLGPASASPGVRRTMFDLPIAARVRAAGGGPGPPSGDAPPAAPDARPDLGATQWRDAPVLRPDVPVAYEPLVRRLFAHPEAGRQ